MEVVAIALPVLLGIMALEYYVSIQQKRRFFSFSDSITNLSIAVLDRLSGLLFAGFFYFIYDYLQTHFGIFQIKATIFNWILLFVLVDFLWYWYHRFSHTVNVFWAEHVVHHSSQEYNFIVGTRITILQSLVRLIFWCILPVIGFNAIMIELLLLIHGAYSFFTHTRLIGKLGWIEHIFVTPSHHRVHHASNENYLDKNFGGVFIFWDKLFGTFAIEQEEVKFGLSHPLETKILLWQLFHFWAELLYCVNRQKSWKEKCRLLLGKPELINPKAREILEKRYLSKKVKHPISTDFKHYIVCQMVLCIIGLIVTLYFSNSLSNIWIWFISTLIILTLINCGAILERRKWVFHLEFIRFLVLNGLIVCLNPQFIYLLFIGNLFGLAFYSHLQRMYFRRCFIELA
jgi:alkylglycerol monooxygenase